MPLACSISQWTRSGMGCVPTRATPPCCAAWVCRNLSDYLHFLPVISTRETGKTHLEEDAQYDLSCSLSLQWYVDTVEMW